MPFENDTYTLPDGSLVTNTQISDASQHNTPLLDIASALSLLKSTTSLNGGALSTHEARIDNPHSVTKAQVGLGLADNTPDIDKPISTATQNALDQKAPNIHSHAITDITSLTATLAGKADTTHSHSIAEVTGLQTTLDGKAASSHTHAIADVVDLQNQLGGKISTSQRGIANGVAPLGADGLVPSSFLPASSGGSTPTNLGTMANEQAADYLTTRRWQYAAATGWVKGTSGASVLRGAGNTDFVGDGFASTTTNDGTNVVPTHGYCDRFIVRLSQAPGTGNTITVILKYTSGGPARSTLYTVTLSDSQLTAEADILTYPFIKGFGFDIEVQTTVGVPANTIKVESWAVRVRQAREDRKILYYYPDPYQVINFTKEAAVPDFFPEVTPQYQPITGSSSNVHYVSTLRTIEIVTDNLMTSNSVHALSGVEVTGPDLTVPWRHAYAGIFSSIELGSGTADQRLYYAVHGENKNYIEGDNGSGAQFTNTVNPAIAIDINDLNTWSGNRGVGFGTYSDGFDAYFGFCSLRSRAAVAPGYGIGQPLTDHGPFMWPSGGYISPDTGELVSQGLRHPSFIEANGYLYCFVPDESRFEPQANGIIVARALVTELQAATNDQKAQVWTTYCGPQLGWLPSLPDGFHRDNIDQFYDVKGPPAQAVSQFNTFKGRFSVFKPDNANFWLALSLYGEWSDNTQPTLPLRWHVDFERSFDLVNWEAIGRAQVGEFGHTGMLQYPTIMRGDGTSHYDIGELNGSNTFYLVGAAPDASEVRRMAMLFGHWADP